MFEDEAIIAVALGRVASKRAQDCVYKFESVPDDEVPVLPVAIGDVSNESVTDRHGAANASEDGESPESIVAGNVAVEHAAVAS